MAPSKFWKAMGSVFLPGYLPATIAKDRRENIEQAESAQNKSIDESQDFQKQAFEYQKDINEPLIKLGDNQIEAINRGIKQGTFLTDDSIKMEFEEELQKLGRAELTKTHEVSEIVKIVENMI